MYKNSIELHKPCISMVVETWLNSKIKDEDIYIENYQTYRRDRGSRGGGIMVNIHNSVPSKRLYELEVTGSNFNEFMVCECSFNGNKVIVLTCYRPPNATIDFVTNFTQVMSNIKNLWFQ